MRTEKGPGEGRENGDVPAFSSTLLGRSWGREAECLHGRAEGAQARRRAWPKVTQPRATEVGLHPDLPGSLVGPHPLLYPSLMVGLSCDGREGLPGSREAFRWWLSRGTGRGIESGGNMMCVCWGQGRGGWPFSWPWIVLPEDHPGKDKFPSRSQSGRRRGRTQKSWLCCRNPFRWEGGRALEDSPRIRS